MLTIKKAEVQKVFDEHLFADAWESASPTIQNKALNHAIRDISALNYDPETPYLKLVGAVAEQIILLLSLNDMDLERVKAQATGVKQRSVEGASEWYYDARTQKMIAPGVLAMLDGYLHRRFGGIR